MEVSVSQEIEEVFFERPHVVILGAGASIAAVPEDRNGKLLPDMRGLLELPRIRSLLGSAGEVCDADDFETAYSRLRESGRNLESANEIDLIVRDYFASVEIPDEVTIYDHLLLSLREKDLIATFNWDPLIVQAEMRLRALGALDLPQVVYLHGNVAISACLTCETAGFPRERCRSCGDDLAPVPLLYPVTEKDYETNPFIAHAWGTLRWGLEVGKVVTIFGYRAPASDVAAITEFQSAWGTPEERQFEQFELIARPGSDHEELRMKWDTFIHTHHYEIQEDFYESWVAHHPRRSGEAYFNQFIKAKFIDMNPVPRGLDLVRTIEWYEELFQAEERHSRPS